MGTEVLNFGILESELEQVKSSLKGVDENIKRLIGRDPSELPLQRPGLKRPPLNDDRSQRPRGLPGNRRVYSHENDEPPNKRRGSVFNRLAGRVTERPSHYEEEFDGKANRQMISKVIVTPKEVPSRQDALDAQSKDEKSKARNRRMFGALLGTLQKFQQEETKLKFKEEKRAQVEKKIEEIEIREKAEIRKERTELFYSRKKKQAEIKMIEMKMGRMRDYMHWEELQKPRMNFIFTKTKPQIHYLPRKLNEANKAALAESKLEIEKMIELKRQETQEELKQIEERMKRNFEPKKSKDTKDVEEDHEHEMEGLEEDRGEQEEAKMETQDLVECSEKVEVPKVLESTEDSEEVTDKSEVVEEKDEEKMEEVAAETNLNGQNSEHD